MAQVSIIQYAEITTGTGRPIRIGSKDVPSTITLTGTSEVYHRVFNDLATTTYTLIYDQELTGIKWWAVKSTSEAMLGSIDGSDASSTNAVHLTANVWQFFGEGTTTSSASGLSPRCSEAEVAIDGIGIYIIGATSADVELLVAY